jgi:CDP-diacylglycerol--serine O-phosphatidyltransferase
MYLNSNKIIFIVPNFLTLCNIFCGCFSICNLFTRQDGNVFYISTVALFFAVLFDILDGRIARLTKTQSKFGIELDSLADIISFGLAPALLLYKWALWPLGSSGIMIICFYVSCGAIRLAKFNVLSNKNEIDSKYFKGLPIPLSAGLILFLVISYYDLFSNVFLKKYNLIFIIMSSLSFLMVSNVKYWSFKKVSFDFKFCFCLFLLILIILFLSFYYGIAASMTILIFCYIFFGLIYHIIIRFIYFKFFFNEKNSFS